MQLHARFQKIEAEFSHLPYRERMLEAVRKDGRLLFFASDELKNDSEIVQTALENSARALEYASNELRNDREVVLAAVKKHPNALKLASPHLQEDTEILRVADSREA